MCPTICYTIGSGLHGPDPNLVACVQAVKLPKSKKEFKWIFLVFSES